MPVKCSLCPIDVSPEHEADDYPLCDNHLRFNPDRNKAENITAALDAAVRDQQSDDYNEYTKTKLEQEQPTVGE